MDDTDRKAPKLTLRYDEGLFEGGMGYLIKGIELDGVEFPIPQGGTIALHTEAGEAVMTATLELFISEVEWEPYGE